jgi:hypothetical protein
MNTPTPFSDELMAAIAAANGTYVMPGTEGDTEHSLRKIKDFFFHGVQVASLKRKRKKLGVAAKRAAQLRSNLQQSESDFGNETVGGSRSARANVPVEGVVYMLQAGDYFKIGMSINLDKRLSQIKLQLPFPVEVVHVIQVAHALQAEAHWHRRFAALRRNGEWFLLSEADVDEFKRVSRM